MDPLIWLEVSLVLIVLYILDRNFFHYVDLQVQHLRIAIALQVHKRVLGFRLWLDRKSFTHKGPVGKFWGWYTLWKIRHNPVYKELFENRDQV